MFKNKNRILVLLSLAVMVASCKKDLDIKNPNAVTLDQLTTESDILSIAQGGTYVNGFNGPGGNSLGWLGDSYFSLGLAYHSLMGDEVGAEAANQLVNQISLPDKVTYDDGTSTVNSAPSKQVYKINNSIFNKDANPLYYEWLCMYSMNNASNKTLATLNQIVFTGDTATKKATLRAWAYWWKGFAYAKIGSMYYAGLIVNSVDATKPETNQYVSSAAMIAESNKNLDMAAAILSAVGSDAIPNTDGDYEDYVGRLIPAFCQVGNGGVLTTDMWKRNINTLKARNLLVNHKMDASKPGAMAPMTASDWNSLLTLTNDGIEQGDYVFTARTATSNGFFSSGTGSVQAQTAINSSSSGLKTFRLSERLYQDFKTGDARKAGNFVTKDYKNQVGGFTFSTRYALKNLGSIANNTIGEQEIFIAGSYEENELMKAEALISLGGASLDAGLAAIDNVRSYQSSGLVALAGSGITPTAAIEELRKERRTALAFRGLAFYDARRNGFIYDVSKGGGRTGAVVYTAAGVVNTNATMNYNFPDYWDVPDNEVYINAPGAGSAAVKNPDN